MTEPGIDMHRSSWDIYARIGRGDLPPLDMIAAEGDEEKNIVVISIIYGIYNNRKKSLKRNEKCYFLFICFVMWSECAHWFIMYQLIIMVLFVFSPASPHLALPARIFQSPFALLWILAAGRNGFLVSSSSKSHESLGERTSPGEFYQFNLFLIPFSCLGIVLLKVRSPCARKFIVIHLRGFLGRGILTSDVHDNCMRLIKL